jgi:acetoacetate decarboxylase
MTFNNKEYLNNCLKDMKATLRRLVQDAVEKDQPLDSPIIKMQEEKILNFAKQIKNMS